MPDPKDAVEFMRTVMDAESSIRTDAIQDLKFRYGDQWPNYAIAARGQERPQLVINETDGYCRQVINNIRQQRPRMNPHPTGAKGSIETAKVIKGMLRHVEVNSSADNSYDAAADYAVTIGWGYIGVRNDYVREDSFNQDLFIDPIDNPFSVYFDNNSVLPDGSDAERALRTTLIRKDQFEREHPGANVGGFSGRGTGDNDPEWVMKEDIRVAEYFSVDRKSDTLLKLSDGMVVFKSELPNMEMLAAAGVMVVGDRPSYRRTVRWRKQTCFEVLEERELPFRWIPIIPVYGVRTFIDGKRDRMGLVRFAKDPQRMINFWQTTITENIAMSPMAKWLMLEGQDEGFERDWQNANRAAFPYLRFKGKSVDGQEFVPQRIAPEPPPEGAITASFMSSQNMQKVVGIFDPQMDRGERDPKSGKAIRQERMQSDNSNFHFYDNLTRSLMHVGRVCLSAFPKVYDVQRVSRIIGDDGRAKLITINEKKFDQTGAIVKVLNDVTGADEYDIVMETGPGYDTKRQEGVEGMMQLLGTPLGEQVAQVGGDLVVRMMDFPGADTLADRMAAANPFSKIDEQEDVPPEQLKMQNAGLQMQLQQAQKVIQEQSMNLKYRMDVAQLKDKGDTRRVLLKATADTHEAELVNQSMQHSVETKAIADQNRAELDALVKLAIKHVDTHHLMAEIDARDRELKQKVNQDTTATT